MLYSEADLGWLGAVSAVQYWVFLAIGIFGVRAMVRRRLPLFAFLAPVALAAVTSVLAYGSVRFRIGIDAALPILVGIGASALLDRRSARTNPAEPASGIVSV